MQVDTHFRVECKQSVPSRFDFEEGASPGAVASLGGGIQNLPLKIRDINPIGIVPVGAGTSMSLDKTKCASYIEDFRAAMKSSGRGQ